MTKAQREAIADLYATQARERAIFTLEKQAQAEAILARQADERAALAKKLGVPLAPPSAGNTDEQLDVTTRAAAPVVPAVVNGQGKRR